MNPLKLAAPLAAIVLLAGCGGQAAETPTQSPSASTQAGSTLSIIGTVSELKESATKAGFPCDKWEATNTTTVSCSGEGLLRVFGDNDALKAEVENLKKQGQPQDSDVHLLIGQNWLIKGALGDLTKVSQEMSGSLVMLQPNVPTTPSTPTVVATPLSKADFKIDLKILKKQCFGSAGCNVTYRIDPKFVGTGELPTGTIEVIYAVKGAESPIVNTFTIEDGEARFDSEETTSINKSSDKLTAAITEVNVRNW